MAQYYRELAASDDIGFMYFCFPFVNKNNLVKMQYLSHRLLVLYTAEQSRHLEIACEFN